MVYHYFKTWTDDGTLNRMHNSLREQVRTQVEGRTRQPTQVVAHGAAMAAVAPHPVGFLVHKGHPIAFAAAVAGLLGAPKVLPRPFAGEFGQVTM